MQKRTHRRQFSRLSIAAVSATAGAALFASALPAHADTAPSYPADAAQAAAVVETATGAADIAASTASPGTPAKAITAIGSTALTVTAPDKANGAVRATDDNGSSFGLTLAGAQDVAGVKAGAGTVVYPNAAAATDIAVQPTTDGGARTLVTLKDGHAPETHRFRLSLPEGADIIEDGQGGFEITREGSEGVHLPVATIDAPWAKDANGEAVPTSYKLDGNDIVQNVETNDKTAFPVVADPKITWGIVTGTVYFKKSETKKIAHNGMLAAMASWALPPGLNAYASIHAAAITKMAGSAKANKRCLKIKIAGGIFIPGEYSGGYCK